MIDGIMIGGIMTARNYDLQNFDRGIMSHGVINGHHQLYVITNYSQPKLKLLCILYKK